MPRVTVLMPNDQDPNTVAFVAVDDGVRIVDKRERATLVALRSTEAWVRFNEVHHSLELVEKATRDTRPGLLRVKPNGFSEIFFREAMNGPAHRSSARRRAMTSSTETKREGSSVAAASRAASASRLATTRSSNLTRSAVVSERT